jgi:hypothetical protein
MTSQSAKRKREQRCEHCDKVIPGGNRARHYKTQHAGIAHTDQSKDASDGKVEEPKSVNEWLRYCALDLSACEVPWPLEKLDGISDLRTQPKETHDQCVAWQIFKDERTTRLPSLERVLVSLDAASCTDVWRLNDAVRLTDHEFLDWKAQLLEKKNPKIRLLNVPVNERVVSRDVQDHYHTMVNDMVQEFYGVGADHPVEVHDATANITPRGTATEIHHDSDPHISTTCGPSEAKPGEPMKLWLLWKASDNRRLSMCYSDTTAALDRMGPCGYLIQRAGESLMLPANVPHAALSLTSHMLYGQTFHVRDRAGDPTTFGLELSARMKPEKAIERVLDCYKEGLQDPDPRIRQIHIDRLLCTMSAEQIVMLQIGRESYLGRLIDTLKNGRIFEGTCGLCEHFGFTPQYDGDCWKSHPIKSEQHTTGTSRRHFQVRKKRLSSRDPVTEELRTSVGPKKSV